MEKVSIIIPTYNRASLINEALNSVINQTYSNWECLIIDDFSTDNTALVASLFSKNDKRFKYFLNEYSKGAQGARNTGISKSTGEFVVFLDSDDVLASHCLEKRMEFVFKNPNNYFYCFPTAVFYSKIGDSRFLLNCLNSDIDDVIRFLRRDMPWLTTGVLWRKKFLKDLKGWDENLDCWQDWDIHVRALINAKGLYIKYINNKRFDSFYRKPKYEYKSISNSEYSNRNIKSKIYLVNKFDSLLHFSIERDSINLEFARLIFEISIQIFVTGNKWGAMLFLIKQLLKRGFSVFFALTWSLYLFVNYRKSIPNFMKKNIQLIPNLFLNNSLITPKNNFGKTLIEAEL